MQFQPEYLSKVKLILWDLDETFWHGTLSDCAETGICAIPECMELVRRASYRGIVQSICSKNDEADALQELEKLGVREFFVFPSISWEPKGQRIRQLLEDMALRDVNVLFLDDNPSNLAEAEHYCPGIMTALPDSVPSILERIDNIGKDDASLSRLKQYRVMEEKREKRKEFASNEEFLCQSHIQVHISTDVQPVAARLFELMQRSNQLNFTKLRSSREEFDALLADNAVEKGYVEVADDYGLYGIVGFYAVRNHKLLHFFFSCRTMGMGIEQYVYAYLGYPELTVIPPVSGAVSRDDGMPAYIRQVQSITAPSPAHSAASVPCKVLLKGPCDLKVMASYLEPSGNTLVAELNYMDENANQADYFNHSINILASLSENTKELYKRYSFLSTSAAETTLFTGEYDVVCLSPLMDATLAVYRSRQTGQRFAFGLYNTPVTREENWEKYIAGKVMTASESHYTRDELAQFSAEFEEISFSPEDVNQNYERIVSTVHAIHPETDFVIFTLAELPYERTSTQSFDGKELLHRQINQALRQGVGKMEHVQFLDVNQFVQKQSDYFDNINHYSKLVYYHLAQEFLRLIPDRDRREFSIKSKPAALYQHIKREVYKWVLLQRVKRSKFKEI